MKMILIIAGKEVQDRIRDRWVLAITVILAVLATGLVYLGSAPTGSVGVAPLAVTIVSLTSLTIFLLPLIALMLSYDAIVGEMERGTLLLLLTYPVSRLQVIFGKFIGHAAVLTFSTLVGYGAAGVAVALSVKETGGQDWLAFGALLLTSAMMGGIFIVIATLTSVLARERSTAAALAIGVWLFFVMLFDFLLLGLLVKGGAWVSAQVFPYLLLLNPADIYRLFNLSAFENVRLFSGMAGLSGEMPYGRGLMVGIMALWTLLPLGAAAWIFSRREP